MEKKTSIESRGRWLRTAVVTEQNMFCETVFVRVDVELYSLKSHERFEVACYSKEESAGSLLPVAIFSLGQ